MTTQSVLLVGRRGDAELAAVATMLRQVGVPVLWVALERLATEPLQLDPPLGLLRLDQRTLRPTVAWTRHLPRPTAPHAGWSTDRAFANDAQIALARQLAWMAAASFPGAAPDQLRQLRDAAQLGFRVPATVVSTQPDAAPRAWRRVILKALDRHFVEGPDRRLAWFHPQIWDRTDTPPWPRPGLPAVLQEYVEHEHEFRVYVVSGRVCAFRIDKLSPADVWLAPERVTARPVVAPPAVTALAVQLAAHWGLTYGAFDILLAHNQPVFLEVNVDGDWRWFETRAGRATVTTTAAQALAELHRRLRRSHSSGGGEPVEPVCFLAGGGARRLDAAAGSRGTGDGPGSALVATTGQQTSRDKEGDKP